MTPPGEPGLPGMPGMPGLPGMPGRPERHGADRFVDDGAGPMVRPYVMTSGRIEPVRGRFDLITLVETVQRPPAAEPGIGPEHLAILDLCRDIMSVAEIAGHLDLPVGTVRVLLGDLLDLGYVIVQEPEPEGEMRDIRMYEEVIDGLRAL